MAKKPERYLPPAIHRGRFEKLTIYEITDSELDALERGSPDSIYLNFAVFCLSTAISFSVAFATSTIASLYVFTVLVVVTTVSYLVGAILLVLWFRSRTSVSKVAQTIRDRLPPEGEVQQLPETPESGPSDSA